MSTTDKPRTRSSARADTADTDLELVVNPEFIHAVPSLAGYVILGRTTHVRLLGASTNVELRVNKDGVPRSVEGKDAQDVRAYFEGVTSAAADRVTALHAASALATPKVTTGAFDVLESLEGEDGPEYTPVYGSRRSARKAAQSARLDAEEAVNLREAARHHTLAALSKCMQAWQQEAARTREAAEALEREAEAELLRKRLLTVFKDDRSNSACAGESSKCPGGGVAAMRRYLLPGCEHGGGRYVCTREGECTVLASAESDAPHSPPRFALSRDLQELRLRQLKRRVQARRRTGRLCALGLWTLRWPIVEAARPQQRSNTGYASACSVGTYHRFVTRSVTILLLRN